MKSLKGNFAKLRKIMKLKRFECLLQTSSFFFFAHTKVFTRNRTKKSTKISKWKCIFMVKNFVRHNHIIVEEKKKRKIQDDVSWSIAGQHKI